MKSGKKWFILVLIFAVIAAGVYFFKKKKAPTDTVREVTISRGDVETSIIATGEVRPENRLEIKSPVAGRIEQILVREGQAVKAGEIIGWMSSSERAALMDAARARGPEEVKHWEALYRTTPILAPLNGTIITRNVEAGQTFGSADTILIMSDRLLVKAQVDETDLAQIKNRQKARITLDSYPNEPMDGQVHKISYESKIVNNVTIYVVDVLPNKTPAYMRSGMTANVTFLISSRKNVLVAPAEAITGEDDEAHVMVKAAQGPAQKQMVKTGLSNGKSTEILSGLNEGDIVVIPKAPSLDKDKDESRPLFGGDPRDRNKKGRR